jgi:hypothetical protein
MMDKKYIFTATPLKRALYFNESQTIQLSHRMTVKNQKGFDMYFSATDYNITLSIKTEKAIDGKQWNTRAAYSCSLAKKTPICSTWLLLLAKGFVNLTEW